MKSERRIDKKEEKEIKNFYAPGIEPATYANMDKRWGMRSEGTLHPICLERSKTVKTFSEICRYSIDINKGLIKRKKKEKKIYAPGLAQRRHLAPYLSGAVKNSADI